MADPARRLQPVPPAPAARDGPAAPAVPAELRPFVETLADLLAARLLRAPRAG